MLTMEVTRSRMGGRCTWEKGGHNGENYGYSQIITDKFGKPKMAMLHNTKGDMICGNHVLFGLREGDFIITDKYLNGLHDIEVLQVTGFIDVCDVSFATLNLCWKYEHKQWSIPSNEISSLKETISEVINVAMDKAMYEGCCDGFYYREKGN